MQKLLEAAESLNVDELRDAAIREAMRRAGGRPSAAGKLLGMPRATLYRHIARLGIETRKMTALELERRSVHAARARRERASFVDRLEQTVAPEGL